MVGHYRVIQHIGGGGMGVVYKAQDMRLGRLVALKVLSPEAVTDPVRRLLFLQEARAASALNHENIVTIYEIGEHEGELYLAMEFVSGRTLATIISARLATLGKALKYAVRIADALSAAHSAGIVHRDIKPSNVMVSDQDKVKILDFGIAKLTEPPPGELPDTVTDRTLPRGGDAAGTVSYMSPEQAHGKHVDGRSDIFSFGVLLYELLSGRHPFRGPSQVATLSSILQDDPAPPTRHNPKIPLEAERVVMRCLEKDPVGRFQDAGDLKVALEWIETDFAARKYRFLRFGGEGGWNWRRAAPLLVAAAIATATVVWYLLPPPPEPPSEAVLVTNYQGLTSSPAISSDGTLIAYASDHGGDDNLDIWVQQLSGGAPSRRTTDPADDTYPDFSSDRTNLVFERAGKGVFVVGVLGGAERMIAPNGLCPKFSPDGSRVAYWVGDLWRTSPAGAVYVVPVEGGEPKRVAATFASARYPVWVDDNHLLLSGMEREGAEEDWWVVPVHGGPAINAGLAAALRGSGLSVAPGPVDWLDGRVVFSAVGRQPAHLWAAALQGPRWQIGGRLLALTFGAGDIEPSIALDGRLAFFSYVHKSYLWRVPLRGYSSGRAPIEPLSAAAAFDTRPSISANGKVLAFLSRRSKIQQVWLRDMNERSESELSTGPGDKLSPAVSPDGSMVAYSVLENGSPSMFVMPTSGSPSRPARRICDNCGGPSDWLPGGSHILYAAGKPRRIFLLDLASGKSSPVLGDAGHSVDQPRISFDGRWIAFVDSIGNDRLRIFIAPFRPDGIVPQGEWIAATDGAMLDDKPRWLGGDELVYFSNRDGFGCLWKQRLDPLTKRPVGSPAELHHFHSPRLSLRTFYRGAFEIAVAGDAIILNLSELTGNIWQTTLPKRK